MASRLLFLVLLFGFIALLETKQDKDEERGGLGGLLRGKLGRLSKRIKGEEKHDLLDDISAFAGKLKPKQWQKQGRRFCRRFPGHPKCEHGRIPEFSELGELIESVKKDRGKFLPRIRKIKIKDPLEGVESGLATEVKKFRRKFGELDAENTKKLRDNCRGRKCREQSEETKKKKDLVLNKVFEFENLVTGKDTTEEVQLRMDRTQQIKQALLEKANLTEEVTAADDGIFDKDLLLTEAQQVYLLNALDKGGVGTDEVPPPPLDDDAPTPTVSRKKRASIFFEENLIQKWDVTRPIQYTFDESLDELDKNDVRGAIAEIQQKTCIKFIYIDNPVGPHLDYIKVDSPTFCGLSYVGRADPANPIYLSFQCGNGRGVALHETMHALGVAHQHLRMDRDQHITVDWSNINPQFYDSFAVSDSKLFTTYGIKYDYRSIMHYNAYTAAIDITRPTMIPKINPAVNQGVLGQRDSMSANDVAILQKMYCQGGCDDKNVYCGAWALKDLCTNPNNAGYLQVNCRKSCDTCAIGK